jgi:hypothetical protein
MMYRSHASLRLKKACLHQAHDMQWMTAMSLTYNADEHVPDAGMRACKASEKAKVKSTLASPDELVALCIRCDLNRSLSRDFSIRRHTATYSPSHSMVVMACKGGDWLIYVAL